MKPRKFFRDGIEEEIIGPVLVSYTREGHIVESYKTVDGEEKYFVTLAGTHWCAHGESIASAVTDARWKNPEWRPSMEALRDEIQKDGRDRKITLPEFRVLTGACDTGCRVALRQAGRDTSPMTAFEVRDIVSKEWGNKLISVLGWDDDRR